MVLEYSDNAVRSMHNAIRTSLAIDDSVPAVSAKPYGVREYSDWKVWRDELEATMKDRGLPFAPITW
jgi:hypothetical protein